MPDAVRYRLANASGQGVFRRVGRCAKVVMYRGGNFAEAGGNDVACSCVRWALDDLKNTPRSSLLPRSRTAWGSGPAGKPGGPLFIFVRSGFANPHHRVFC